MNENNPHFWGEKRYHSLDYHLKETFGEKVYKLSLNGGMSCPNRDGTIGRGGCIFCSAGGSGEFAGNPSVSITEQIESQKEIVRKKFPVKKFIAYFQAFTNTYAPVERLRALFTEAISHPDIIAISIGTRPDCLPEDVLDLLGELNKIKPVWIELGLQTIHDATAQYIRRGYPLACFETALENLQKRGLETIVHVILGLPLETREDILKTIEYLAHKNIQGIKFHLLHVLKGTDLATDFANGNFSVFSMEEYVELVIQCLERLPKNFVVHRITGDGPRDLMIAPLWSQRKRAVMNSINNGLAKQNTWQGRLFK